MRGLPPAYWQLFTARWMDRAFVCRYGGQSIYDLLGRDPRREPLTALEQATFAMCLLEHVTAERKPFTEIGLPVPEE